jgi:hypothetical protein
MLTLGYTSAVMAAKHAALLLPASINWYVMATGVLRSLATLAS